MPSNVPPISELLDSVTHSAVHLEMRDVYAVTPESNEFAKWRATGLRSNDPKSDYWRDWVGVVQRTTARGVVIRRARIVSEPASEYIRFEHAGTPVNVGAGEHVRWLPRHRASDLALPGNDFWLFDDRLVRFGYFGGDGTLTGHELDEGSSVIKMCSSAFEAVWARAIPHQDYEIH